MITGFIFFSGYGKDCSLLNTMSHEKTNDDNYVWNSNALLPWINLAGTADGEDPTCGVPILSPRKHPPGIHRS